MSKYKSLRGLLEEVLDVLEECDTIDEAVEKLNAMLDEFKKPRSRTDVSS